MLRKIPLIVIFLITLTFFILSLAACAPYTPDSTKAGVCNELNSRMIFDGSNNNIQKAEISEAQDSLVQRNYDRNCES